MKQIFRCEYCDKLGIAEEIEQHELSCVNNYNNRSCYTCAFAENHITSFTCKQGKELPLGKIYESCPAYEWDKKDHTTCNPVPFNNLFGGAFSI